MKKPALGIYKFTSCDGCQLAFLNAGEALLRLASLVDIVHFVEAGMVAPEAPADIAFVEGSISTPDERERIVDIRSRARYLVTIGACATAGGIQALRNHADGKAWLANVYASPETVQALETSTAIAQHVPVDVALWGCPVNTGQVLDTVKSLCLGALPRIDRAAVCQECKRQHQVCVLVTGKGACMGPVTQTGCGVLCPRMGRACYACYGPSENPNTRALGETFRHAGLTSAQIARQFSHINNQAPAFDAAASCFRGIPIVRE